MLATIAFAAMGLAVLLYRISVNADRRLISVAAEVGEFVLMLTALMCAVLLWR